MKGQEKRRGFTLIETVVTVGIVAALASVVVPQVVKQFDTADPARMQNDLKNLQAAIEIFALNVRTPPGDVDDLTNQITTSDTTLTSSATQPVYLSPSQTGGWKGPYVDFTIADIVDGSAERDRPTGFGARILETFVCYNSETNAFGSSRAVDASPDVACPNAAGQKFLAIQILDLATSATDATFLALNELFDGANEANPELNGRVRYNNNGGGPDIVFFLAISVD